MTTNLRLGRVVRRYVLAGSLAATILAQQRLVSPDGTLYAVAGPGQKVGQGEERERFSVFDSENKLVSVLHIWLREPDGTFRAGIRGCESSGWIDEARFFCAGTHNPSMGIYLWFDARTGKEIGEAIGSNFTWSPDQSTLAFFGNVPHFTPEEGKSDSLVVEGRAWPEDSSPVPEQHWFHSDLSWSPDSKYVAVVDHQRRMRKAFFLEVVDRGSHKRTEYQLNWPDEADEWWPAHDFTIEWTDKQVTVHHAETAQGFAR